MHRRSSLHLLTAFFVFIPACKSDHEPKTAAPATTAEASLPPPSRAAAPSGDVLETSPGPVSFHPVHHASLWLQIGSKVVWSDPTSENGLDEPKADVILVSDIHPDHLDSKAIDRVRKDGTRVIGPRAVADQLPGTEALANGETKDLGFMKVEAIAMYNVTRGPAPGKLFHDKGRGNGYVLTLGDKRVYLSGDTECTPEMKALKGIDVAFVCMNLPYTMPPSEAADCVRAFHPKVLYPYHYRGSNLDELEQKLQGSGVEVRERAWY